MASALQATDVGTADAPRSVVMLHGIYGRGRNWLNISRRLVERRRDYKCVLVDLPWHGDSAAGRHDQTVTGVARDLADWLDAQNIEPDAVLGHSFGGKVAMALATRPQDTPRQLWVIDSTPESGPLCGSAWRMLQSVRTLPDRFGSRDELIAALGGQGWAAPIAQWMATNLDRQDDGFVWRLDFDVMEQLLQSFAGSDLWPAVETAASDRTWHFVKATRSNVLSDSAVARLERLGRARVEVHHLEGGHWIHAEQPHAMVDLLARHLL
jgi:esterase